MGFGCRTKPAGACNILCNMRHWYWHFRIFAVFDPSPLSLRINSIFTRATLCSRGISCGPVSVCMYVCLSVSLSVTSRSSIKTAKQIKIVFWRKGYLDLSYTVLKVIQASPKIRVLPSWTLSQTLHFKNFETARRPSQFYQLRWTLNEINWRRSSVASLSPARPRLYTRWWEWVSV